MALASSSVPSSAADEDPPSSSPFLDEYNRTQAGLINAGLSERESSIYLALLVGGEMKAGEIARQLSLHRLNVYNTLRDLQEQDLVESTLSKPMVFRAVPLESALELVKLRHREEEKKKAAMIEELVDSGRRLDRMLAGKKDAASLSMNGGGRGGDRIKILSGRKPIRRNWERLLALARREILIVTTERGILQSLLMESLEELSAKARREGVVVKVFTPVTKANSESLRQSRLKVRDLVASNSAGLCIFDGRAIMIVTEQTEDSPPSQLEETAVLTDSGSIVGMIRTMFFVGWDTSPTLEEAVRGRSAASISISDG
jgi:sugar-specific transcriptional regulator TrmB